jgi:K+/H+ antiporter YhaU regulatory subunit KhtT
VLFNYERELETTELYMQDNAPWLGRTIEEINLRDEFDAGVIGIRQASHRFVYAPPGDYVINLNDVLIVITPMENADALRLKAHGGSSKRPRTLRRRHRDDCNC